MEFMESMNLIKKLDSGNCGFYLDSLCDELGDYALGLRHKGSSVFIPITPQFDSDNEVMEHSRCKLQFWDENTKAWFFYPFNFGEFFVSDWEVILVDSYDMEVKDTCANYLLDKYDDALLNHKDMIDKLNKVLERDNKTFEEQEKNFYEDLKLNPFYDFIEEIDIYAVFSEKRFSYKSHFSYFLNDVQNLQDDVFEVDICYKDCKSENLAEIEESELEV